MALNPEIEGIVTLRGDPSRPNGERLETVAAPVAPPGVEQPAPVITAVFPRPEEELPQPGLSDTPALARRRRGWVVPAAIGVAGLIASATLGGLLWSTTTQRDTARHQLAATHVTLAGSQQQVRAAQTDAATRKLTADYVSGYIVDSGRVLTDYQTIVGCNTYSECRTAAQQTLSDMQAFQSDRAAAAVPPALANSDAMLRDGLSAGIAGLQEFITGMDNDDVAKIKAGAHKVDVAMLSIGKAETALGAALR